MFEITTQLDWRGPQAKKSITNKLYRNVRVCGKEYKDLLQQSIARWGSVSFIGNLRKRVKSSRPGEPPYQQTGNLHNSIVFKSQQTQDEYIAEISTDQEYAITLELGGTVQVPQQTKTHTRYQLINPPKNIGYISPRPAWVPLFNRLISRFIAIISR